jgi:hypothetical protein
LFTILNKRFTTTLVALLQIFSCQDVFENLCETGKNLALLAVLQRSFENISAVDSLHDSSYGCGEL